MIFNHDPTDLVLACVCVYIYIYIQTKFVHLNTEQTIYLEKNLCLFSLFFFF